MPYLAHFGLKEHPFSLTPNTGRYFPTSGKTQVLQSLEYGIHRSAGIMKVVGDVGTGKTLLCRLLLRQLTTAETTDGTAVDNAGIAYLNAPQAEGDALIALVCAEFGLPTGDRASMLRDLNAFLLARHEAGAETVLVVDEAQALGAPGLETIRLLSNLETERAKLLQIVLFGQPELDVLLARPDLRQVNQRIAFSFDSGPFSRAEVGAYVKHCLRMSRLDGVAYDIFEPKALEAIAQASQGVPRVINILCDKALLIAYGDGARAVSRTHARGAIADSASLLPRTGGDAASSGTTGNVWAWAAGIAGFALAGLLALWLFGGERLGLVAAAPKAEAVAVQTDAAPLSPPLQPPAEPPAQPSGAPPSVEPPTAASPVSEPEPVPVPVPVPVVSQAPVMAADPPAEAVAVPEPEDTQEPAVPEVAPASEAPAPAQTPSSKAAATIERFPLPASGSPPSLQDAALPPPAAPDAVAKAVPPVVAALAKPAPLPTPKPAPVRPTGKPTAKTAEAKPPATAPAPAPAAATKPAAPSVTVRSVQVRTVVPVDPGAPAAARRSADGTWEWR